MNKKRTEKRCVSCEKVKPATTEHFFYRNKSRGWFSSWCKDCRIRKREEKSCEELLAQRIRRGIKPCRVCGSSEKEKGRTYCEPCFSKRKREKKRIDKAIYKGRLRKAMPPWADKQEIKRIYAERPDGFHVDHIVPIRGELVSGLHVEYNLQYLPVEENMAKSNHFSMEHEGRR